MVDAKLFGDYAKLLELYAVEPGCEHWDVNVDGCVVSPVGIPAVNDVYTAVAVGELVRGMVQHPSPHTQLARAIRVLVRVGLEVGES